MDGFCFTHSHVHSRECSKARGRASLLGPFWRKPTPYRRRVPAGKAGGERWHMRKYVRHLLFRQCTLQNGAMLFELRSNSVALGSVHIANHWAFLIKHCCNAEEGYQVFRVLHLLCVKWLATCQSKNIRQARARRNRS